jgi:Domain of unknown function (DUF1902)
MIGDREELKMTQRASQEITVKVAWDPEARVWYIDESSLPGLDLEAETIDELRDKLPGAIEDFLEDAGDAVTLH